VETCAISQEYTNQLSQASIDTLAHQGGPLSDAELEIFLATPGADVALRLRQYDDQGKVPDQEVPQLDAYHEAMYTHLSGQLLAIQQ
jgi:predicted HD phosphohydrolase